MDNFFKIYDWMITKYHLKGNELLIYAKLLTHYEVYKSSYKFGVKQLARELGITEKATYNSLKRLYTDCMVEIAYIDNDRTNHPYFNAVIPSLVELTKEKRKEQLLQNSEKNIVDKWLSTEKFSHETEKISHINNILNNNNNITNKYKIKENSNDREINKFFRDVLFCPYLKFNTSYVDIGLNFDREKELLKMRIVRNSDQVEKELKTNMDNIFKELELINKVNNKNIELELVR